MVNPRRERWRVGRAGTIVVFVVLSLTLLWALVGLPLYNCSRSQDAIDRAERDRLAVAKDLAAELGAPEVLRSRKECALSGKVLVRSTHTHRGASAASIREILEAAGFRTDPQNPNRLEPAPGSRRSATVTLYVGEDGVTIDFVEWI